MRRPFAVPLAVARFPAGAGTASPAPGLDGSTSSHATLARC